MININFNRLDIQLNHLSKIGSEKPDFAYEIAMALTTGEKGDQRFDSRTNTHTVHGLVSRISEDHIPKILEDAVEQFVNPILAPPAHEK